MLVQPGGHGGVVYTGQRPGFDVVGTGEQVPPAESSAVGGVDVEPILAVLAPAHRCGFMHRGEGYGGPLSPHLAVGRHHLRAIVPPATEKVTAAAWPTGPTRRASRLSRPYLAGRSPPAGSSEHGDVAAPRTLRRRAIFVVKNSRAIFAPFSDEGQCDSKVPAANLGL